MKEFTVVMALVDFVPVVLFMLAAIMLQRDLYNKMSKGAFALFAAGTVDVFCAGALKAAYKLLYALGVCDFETLSTLFFPMQAIGFLLAGAGVVAMLSYRQSDRRALYAVAAPPLFSGTPLFVALMVLGLGGIGAGLSIISVRMKKPLGAVLFILAFLFSLGMGYLSSRDFTQAYMNWVAQIVNIAGQGSLLLGAVLLHRAGLRDFMLEKEERT